MKKFKKIKKWAIRNQGKIKSLKLYGVLFAPITLGLLGIHIKGADIVCLGIVIIMSMNKK